MASRARGSLARGVGEARAIAGLGRPELVCRPSPQEWGSLCKQGRGEVSGTEATWWGGRRGETGPHRELQQSGGVL